MPWCKHSICTRRPKELTGKIWKLDLMPCAEKPTHLTTTKQLQTALYGAFPESGQWEFWVAFLAREISTHQGIYAQWTTSLDRLSGCSTAADMVLMLGSELFFNVDRNPDITRFSSEEAD